MEDGDLSQDWVPLLGQLDRHVSSGRLSPDTAALSDLMDTYQVPGVGIAVGHVSGAVWAAGYGVTGGETSTPVTAGTAGAAGRGQAVGRRSERRPTVGPPGCVRG